jgi:hypothetical protein
MPADLPLYFVLLRFNVALCQVYLTVLGGMLERDEKLPQCIIMMVQRSVCMYIRFRPRPDISRTAYHFWI